MKKSLKQAIAAFLLTAAITAPSISGSAGAAAATEAAAQKVPIRDVAEQGGAIVTWDDNSRTVTVKQGNMTLVLKIGSAEATLNGKPFNVGEPIEIVNEKTVVPISLFAQVQALQAEEVFSGSKDGGQMSPSQSEAAAKAADFLAKLTGGHFAEATNSLGPNLRAVMPDAVLQQLWNTVEKQAGPLGKQLSSKVEENSVHRSVTSIYQGTAVPVEITIRLDKAGFVDDFVISPAQPPSAYIKPSYENSAKYTEQEVVVGDGAFALPGTLTIPAGEGPFPAVVLVQGSGPNDRDSSIGGAKPFRDLAVGLASHNIAVLRYEKVTKEHSLKFSLMPKPTLQVETVDDALKAVDLLKGMKSIDSSRIFVAGHSQGGMAVPKMIQLDQAGAIAGAVVLEGPSFGYADTLIDQQQLLLERVKSLGLPSTPYEQSASQWISIAQMIKDPKNTVDHIPADFPLGQPYWWFEQKDYVPGEAAKKQTRPMLVLQGENDWQVSMKQFDGWKQALQNRKNVQFKSYPKVNHLLAEYDNVSIGAEYTQPSNVSSAIIEDIAKWVNSDYRK